MRAVGYIRVSDTSQVEGHSLDAQERLFAALCKTKGWEPVAVYREEGKTAHVDAIAKRPVFRQLLHDAQQHRFDIVIVHTLDRWARNLRVQLEAMAMLTKADVGFVSIAEQIDWSTAHGRLQAQILGSFAEYFSEALSNHVKKGVTERALQGRHLGSVPFGYLPCSTEGCDPEHPGGVHVVPREADAVRELLRRYATGTTTCVLLAAWLNREGFRTRNRHRFEKEGAKSRFFTSSSVRGLLHNPFYAGKVRHRDELLDGAHEAVVSWALFEQVQANLKRNAGRSTTLTARPAREYLLKGLVRCAHCGMPMWAQTYQNGRQYYREHRGSRGAGECVNAGGAVRCEVVDGQVGALIESLVLPEDWLDAVLERISLRDEVARVRAEREQAHGKLRRLGKAFVDGMVDEPDYERHKAQLEFDLTALVVPEADAVAEAGRLVQRLPELWAAADLAERRRLLLTLLDAVYVDAREARRAVGIRPKAAFEAVIAMSQADAGSRSSQSVSQAPEFSVYAGR